MFYFLIQKGITMKSLIKTTCTALLFTGILTGCNSNTTSKQEKSALEKNAMHYGEIVKTNTIERQLRMQSLKNRQRAAPYYSCYD